MQKNDDNNNKTESKTDSPPHQTSEEPNTNPTENTRHSPVQISKISYSEIFTAQVQNPSVETQQHFSEVFSLEPTQAEKARLRLQT